MALAFREFQQAWTERDLARMRPYFTDALFDQQRYWVEAYKAQGLVNRTDGARIIGLELARVASDRWYDAITVRLAATGADYVVRDRDGTVVRGKPRAERPYTEYWTFIRAAEPIRPAAHGARVPELRGAAGRRDGRRLPVLQGEGHDGRVRLGAQPDRAGRGLRRLTTTVGLTSPSDTHPRPAAPP